MKNNNRQYWWFANYYLDEFDRVIKEKLGLKYYSRYMDDCVIIHDDKEYLRYCLKEITESLRRHALDFNEKTVIFFPLKNGVNYLGWHFYITDTGKIIRRVTHRTKFRFKRRLLLMQKQYKQDAITFNEVKVVLSAYHAHLIQGYTYRLMAKTLDEFTLTKSNDEKIWWWYEWTNETIRRKFSWNIEIFWQRLPYCCAWLLARHGLRRHRRKR